MQQPTEKERRILRQFINLAPDPETSFTYDELLGFLYGLAITPDVIMPSEWFPIIFGDEMPMYESVQQVEEMTTCLTQLYNRMVAAFHDNDLVFPFDMNEMEDKDINIIYEWVSGFEEALAMRDELWDPEEFPELNERQKEEIYYSLMVIQGLVEPETVLEFFESLPDEVFLETFPDIDLQETDKATQIQFFLFASLPLSIGTLQKHSRVLETKRQQRFIKKKTKPVKARKAAGTKSNVIQVDFRNKQKKGLVVPVYQLKISLQGAKPPIWRRIQLPGALTLGQLHQVIQVVMGWHNQHLHQFLIDRTCYCPPEKEDNWRTTRPKDENKHTIHELADKLAPSFQYIYDFGDNWLHQLVIEKTLAPEEAKPYPVLLTGRRACPPEDAGGVPGYMEQLQILADPDHENHNMIKGWLGKNFDPARFGKIEITAANKQLTSLL